MAGRPRKMVERVEKLEVLAIGLFIEVMEAMPAMYYEKPDGNDPLNSAWRLAAGGALTLTVPMEELGDLVRAKAAITRPGPSAQFWSDPPEGADLAPEKAGKGEKGP